MDEETVDRVFRLAMGLAEGMTKDASLVSRLTEEAGGDKAVLEAARRRAEEETERASHQETDAVADEGAPEAPALFATRLLQDALEELDRSS